MERTFGYIMLAILIAVAALGIHSGAERPAPQAFGDSAAGECSPASPPFRVWRRPRPDGASGRPLPRRNAQAALVEFAAPIADDPLAQEAALQFDAGAPARLGGEIILPHGAGDGIEPRHRDRRHRGERRSCPWDRGSDPHSAAGWHGAIACQRSREFRNQSPLSISSRMRSASGKGGEGRPLPAHLHIEPGQIIRGRDQHVARIAQDGHEAHGGMLRGHIVGGRQRVALVPGEERARPRAGRPRPCR